VLVPARLPRQALTRNNILVLAIGASMTVWLWDVIYEEHVAQRAADKLRRQRESSPPRVPDV